MFSSWLSAHEVPMVAVSEEPTSVIVHKPDDHEAQGRARDGCILVHLPGVV